MSLAPPHRAHSLAASPDLFCDFVAASPPSSRGIMPITPRDMSRDIDFEMLPCREGTHCLSCGQGPNDVERDLLPERSERVAWERRAKDAEGLPA